MLQFHGGLCEVSQVVFQLVCLPSSINTNAGYQYFNFVQHVGATLLLSRLQIQFGLSAESFLAVYGLVGTAPFLHFLQSVNWFLL